MSPLQIQELIQAGESETVEFKRGLPPAAVLARTIAAFANAGGGTLLLGISENPKARVTGVDPDRAEHELLKAARMLTPLPEVRTSRVAMAGLDVVAADITASTALVLAPDGLFKRVGEIDRPFTPAEAVEKVSASNASAQDTASLVEALARLTKQIDEQALLLSSLLKANHWTRKGFWVAVGAIAGAVAKILIS